MAERRLRRSSKKRKREKTVTNDISAEQSTEMPINVWERATAAAASKQSDTSTLSTTNNSGGGSCEVFRDRRQKISRSVTSFMQQTLNKGVDGLKQEYLATSKAVDPREAVAFKENNINGKNRFTDLCCLDLTRVVLRKHPIDYIHANYIASIRNKHRFIVTQGPLDTSIVDFWRMIVQESVESIVMLCDFYEENRSKCARYFPTEKGERMMFDNYEIICSHISDLMVKKMDPDEQRIICTELKVSSRATVTKVNHYRWGSWPDRKVPKSTQAVLTLLHTVRSSITPIVVHCSTGIGRACTLVAIEVLLEDLIAGKEAPTVELLQNLRKQRAHAISTDLQWVFVHKAVIDYFNNKGRLKCCADMCRVNKFYEDYKKFVEESAKLK